MDPENRAILNSVFISLVGAALSFLTAWFWFQRKKALDAAVALTSEHEKVKLRVADLETKLALVTQAVVPISTAFQAILIKELTHYHTPEMDELMVKIGPPNLLTKDEENRLFILLEERTRDMGPLISESERGAAHILPVVMARARAENEVPENTGEMKLVGLPPESGATAVEQSEEPP